ncbi:hypothetical protein HDV57DRAFT_481061 [Trichoderma longibrachiatum]
MRDKERQPRAPGSWKASFQRRGPTCQVHVDRLLLPSSVPEPALGCPHSSPLSLLTPSPPRFCSTSSVHKSRVALRGRALGGVGGGVPLVCLARSDLGPAWGPLTRVDHQVEWRVRKGGCWRHAKEQLEASGAGRPGGVWRERKEAQGNMKREGRRRNKCTPVTLGNNGGKGRRRCTVYESPSRRIAIITYECLYSYRTSMPVVSLFWRK